MLSITPTLTAFTQSAMAAFTCPTRLTAAISATPRSKPALAPPLSLSAPLRLPNSFQLKTLNPTRLSTAIAAAKSPPPTPAGAATPTPGTLKSRLRSGETLYGIFLLSFSPTMAEIAALAGYDFAVVDMEHGPGGIAEALHCLRALAGTHTPAILRLPESSPAWAKKALDLGPQGIMFPMVDSPKDARRAVSFCRFPPRGVRGAAHPVVRASGYGVDEGYLAGHEQDLVIMVQVESEDGAKRAEQIAAVDGVDCVQMGPLDLSASMGYLWDPGHKKVREALRAAEKGVLASDGGGSGGAWLAGFAMPHDAPEAMARRGYHMVAGAVDVGLFRSAAVEDVRRFRASLMEGGDGEDGVEVHGKDADEKYWSE